MTLEHVDAIYARACARKGQAQLNANLSAPLPASVLAKIGDDRWLAAFTQSVFQSGFVWKIVQHKWPEFERAFFAFAPEKMLLLSDMHIENLMSNEGIIRNRQKIMTVAHNAQMILDVAKAQGSFSEFVASWPAHNIVELWLYLKQHGARLGGNTGPFTLRRMGKDTFLLTQDVLSYLRAQGIVSSAPTSKRALLAVQHAFNTWQDQSGLSMTQLSQIIAMSVGDNRP